MAKQIFAKVLEKEGLDPKTFHVSLGYVTHWEVTASSEHEAIEEATKDFGKLLTDKGIKWTQIAVIKANAKGA